MFYSKTTNGFYTIAVHGNMIPSDAVEVSQPEYENLMAGIESGKLLSADEFGRPVLIDQPGLTDAEINNLVTTARAAAYRNESDPIFFKAQRGEATMEEWTAKVSEIKTRYPDGVIPV